MTDGIRCTFQGTLTGDAALEWTERGEPELTFALSLPLAERQASTVDVVRVTVFGAQAEALDGSLRQGNEVRVEGRLRLGGCQFVLGIARCEIGVVAWKVDVVAVAR